MEVEDVFGRCVLSSRVVFLITFSSSLLARRCSSSPSSRPPLEIAAGRGPMLPSEESSDFRHLRIEDDLYMDKSMLIHEYLWNKKKITLVTRPKNWGKSVNMNMLNTFLQIETDANGIRLPENRHTSRNLFLGSFVDIDGNVTKLLRPLRIAECPESMQFQGQVPVIYVSFGEAIEGGTYAEIETSLKTKVAELFRRYHYLETSGVANQYDRKDFRAYCSGDFDTEMLKNSLRFLSALLHRHFDRRLHILIDHYDAPINDFFHIVAEEYENEFCENMTETRILRKVYNSEDFRRTLRLFRYILSHTFKNNPHLEKSLITGVVKLAKDNFFKDLNVYECDVLQPCFCEHYGFTQAELDDLLTRKLTTAVVRGHHSHRGGATGSSVNRSVGVAGRRGKINSWFGGYAISGWKMYNPLSVSRYLKRRQVFADWTSDGNLWLIKRILVYGDVQGDLIKLSVGKLKEDVIESMEVSFRDVGQSELYPLLLHNGYLVVESMVAEDNLYKFKVPNLEMNVIFEKSIQEWAKLNLPANSNVLLHYMYHYLSSLNVKAFADTLKVYVGTGMQQLTLNRNSPENVYIAYVYQIARQFCKTYYVIYQEISADTENVVIVLVSRPSRTNNAVVLAYNVLNKAIPSQEDEEKTLNALAKNLLTKTIDKGYDQSVKEQYSYVNETVTISVLFYRGDLVLKWANNDYIRLFKSVKIPKIC